MSPSNRLGNSIYLDPDYQEIMDACEQQNLLVGFKPADLNERGDRVQDVTKGVSVDVKTGEVTEYPESQLGLANTDLFPFTLNELDSWIVKRKDGTVVKYILDTDDRDRVRALVDVDRQLPARTATATTAGYVSAGTVSAYCHHNPKDEPAWEDPNGKFSLHPADEYGVKTDKHKFDMVLDAGSVIAAFMPAKTLYGDPEICGALSKYDTSETAPRIVRFDWLDRQAPDLEPAFWPALIPYLKGRVIVNCQGGHGRTGTIMVCLMMVQTDYSALDAITHLRAVHCPRAIESVVQHQYINQVAAYLGREANALDDDKVKNFKQRFLDEVTSEFAKPYQARLKGVK